jgi:hypothetical protein
LGKRRGRVDSSAATVYLTMRLGGGAPAVRGGQPPQAPLRLGPDHDGIDGGRIRYGRWVLAHNLVKISGLIEATHGG